LGKIITGLVGIVWSVAIFFVTPVIACENLGPNAAFKKSAMLMKEKWGESIGAGFSFVFYDRHYECGKNELYQFHIPQYNRAIL
jgi:hypothetical protein